MKDCFIEEISRNELISKWRKKFVVFKALNYFQHLLILISIVTGCVFISAFTSLNGIPIGFPSSSVGLKIFVITAGMKKYESIIKKRKKKHDKITLLAKSKFNSIGVLIFKAWIDSNIVLINNALKNFYDMKGKIKNSNDK